MAGIVTDFRQACPRCADIMLCMYTHARGCWRWIWKCPTCSLTVDIPDEQDKNY